MKSWGKPKREQKQHWEWAKSFTGIYEHYSYNFKRIHALTEHVPAEDLAHNILYKALIPPQIVFPSLFKEAPVVGGVGDDTGLVHMRSARLASALWTQNELQLLLPRAGASSSPSSCLNVHCHGQQEGVGSELPGGRADQQEGRKRECAAEMGFLHSAFSRRKLS